MATIGQYEDFSECNCFLGTRAIEMLVGLRGRMPSKPIVDGDDVEPLLFGSFHKLLRSFCCTPVVGWLFTNHGSVA